MMEEWIIAAALKVLGVGFDIGVVIVLLYDKFWSKRKMEERISRDEEMIEEVKEEITKNGKE